MKLIQERCRLLPDYEIIGRRPFRVYVQRTSEDKVLDRVWMMLTAPPKVLVNIVDQLRALDQHETDGKVELIAVC